MCTANERITNLDQIATVVEKFVEILHAEEDAGAKFNSVTEHSPYTEFGKAVFLFNADGCDRQAVSESIARIVTKMLQSKVTTKMTASVSDTNIPWFTKVTFEFVF